MFWADKVKEEARRKFKAQSDAGEVLVVRDEKTASGRVHVGSMRGVAIHDVVSDVLTRAGTKALFSYEINDFDPMDGIPAMLTEAEWKQYLGMPLNRVPSPDGRAKNFAEFYAAEFCEVITKAGFTPTFYRGSELYLSGKMNDVLRIALEHTADIRRIYKEVSGSQKKDDWLPVSMVCAQCGKIGTTHAYTFDGEKVSYRCIAGAGGAEGCGYEGSDTPWNGNAKLPWKVEWPAKWKVVGVHIEGAGKDHSTRGGSRDVANHISKDVFGYEPPLDIPYEFFLVGGAKMSSSKGRGSSAKEVSDLVPQHIFRLALLGAQPERAMNLDPAGETIPLWFDWYDKIAEKYWSGVADDDARLFELVHAHTPPERMYLPRFSTVVFVAQMPHLNLEKEVSALKGGALTSSEIDVLNERVAYVKTWLSTYAPDAYKFELQQTPPASMQQFSALQKDAFARIAVFVAAHNVIDGAELHAHLHALKAELGMDAKQLFGGIYQAFLGRDSGPQAGWFLATLDRNFLLGRLQVAAK